MNKTLTENELLALLRLQATENVGDIRAKKLIARFGSAENVFNQSSKTLKEVEGLGSVLVNNLLNSENIKKAEFQLKFIQDNNIKYHSFKCKDYPSDLKQTIDSPILLFSKGNFSFQNKRMISIIGTRNSTTYGNGFCHKLVEELSFIPNLVVVSGFAYGIDIAAHKACMDFGVTTLACLAHGFDTIYPKAHQKYCEKMLENGGFLTDFGCEVLFDRKNFIRRNRIIAGLSKATIVVESAEKGGSLVTADIAFSYDREVFAVPGRTTDLCSVGCNDLIKNNKAQMITSAEDFLFYMGWQDIKFEEVSKEEKIEKVEKKLPTLSSDEKIIVDFLKENTKPSLDEMTLKLSMPVSKLSSLLFQLEMKGVVKPYPGKIFVLS